MCSLEKSSCFNFGFNTEFRKLKQILFQFLIGLKDTEQQQKSYPPINYLLKNSTILIILFIC